MFRPIKHLATIESRKKQLHYLYLSQERIVVPLRTKINKQSDFVPNLLNLIEKNILGVKINQNNKNKLVSTLTVLDNEQILEINIDISLGIDCSIKYKKPIFIKEEIIIREGIPITEDIIKRSLIK